MHAAAYAPHTFSRQPVYNHLRIVHDRYTTPIWPYADRIRPAFVWYAARIRPYTHRIPFGRWPAVVGIWAACGRIRPLPNLHTAVYRPSSERSFSRIATVYGRRTAACELHVADRRPVCAPYTIGARLVYGCMCTAHNRYTTRILPYTHSIRPYACRMRTALGPHVAAHGPHMVGMGQAYKFMRTASCRFTARMRIVFARYTACMRPHTHRIPSVGNQFTTICGSSTIGKQPLYGRMRTAYGPHSLGTRPAYSVCYSQMIVDKICYASAMELRKNKQNPLRFPGK